MKKIIITSSICVGIFLFLTKSALALGLGFYFTGGGGKTYWEEFTSYSTYYFEKIGYPSTNAIIGGGLIIDTNVAGDKLFNYRLNVGVEKFIANNSDSIHLKRFSFINTWGYGILRTETLRFWLGPQFGVRFMWGRNYTYVTKAYNLQLFNMKNLVSYNMFGLDLGLTIGLNYNIGEVLTLSIETGIKYEFIPGIKSSSYQITGHGYEGYGSLAVIFRINDKYISK